MWGLADNAGALTRTLAFAMCGCQAVLPVNKASSRDASDPEYGNYADAIKKIDAADEALQGSPEKAAGLYLSAREALFTSWMSRVGKPLEELNVTGAPNGAAEGTLPRVARGPLFRSLIGHARAMHALHRDEEAITDVPIASPGRGFVCPSSIDEECRKHMAWAKATFPSMAADGELFVPSALHLEWSAGSGVPELAAMGAAAKRHAFVDEIHKRKGSGPIGVQSYSTSVSTHDAPFWAVETKDFSGVWQECSKYLVGGKLENDTVTLYFRQKCKKGEPYTIPGSSMTFRLEPGQTPPVEPRVGDDILAVTDADGVKESGADGRTVVVPVRRIVLVRGILGGAQASVTGQRPVGVRYAYGIDFEKLVTSRPARAGGT